ncbi:MAG: SpoIIE family protein phosphatase, partial [Candidatus Micrarchaeota archaeon]
NGKLHIAHVGDSRVYLLRNNELVQLTRDHNVGQDLRDMGEPEEKAARLDHILTRSLGITEKAEPESQTVQLQHKDRILLASDGLKTLSKERIKAILAEKSRPAEAAKELVEKADQAGLAAGGGHDNITAVVADYLLKLK